MPADRRVVTQVLFVQGGGEGAHDDWDRALVDSLARELGDGYDLRYPRMPQEDDPDHGRWAEAIATELASLDDGAVVVAHSVGATVSAIHLVEDPSAARRLGLLVLIAAPFVGPGGWPSDGPAVPADAGAWLPSDLPVHLVVGTDDDTVPIEHAELYQRAIPQARLHVLPGRDHQLANDLSEVARLIGAAGAG